jgi:hypothetical protein
MNPTVLLLIALGGVALLLLLVLKFKFHPFVALLSVSIIVALAEASSIRRRGSRIAGKNEPFRSFGIRNRTSPAWVATSRARYPFWSVTRVSARS